VNIQVKGQSGSGVITDIDGHFYFDVPDRNSVLVITYVGFQTQEIRVGSDINFDIVLEEDVASLDEVVVTGYGSQKRMSVIGSISTLQPKKLEVGSTRALSNNLAGQIAGIIAVQRSGEPGYDASNFWIRGIASFSGTQTPLVLVDGIERDLNNIDPAEIESFSVLKDASASAMYGVRGANGVIVINTKRGKVGAPTVNVRVEHSISQPTKLPSFIGAADYMTLLNELKEDRNHLPYTQEQIDRTREGYDRDLYPDVNWLDAITKDYAYSTRANLTVSGGSNFLRYSLVGSYFGEKGIMETDKTLPYDTSTGLTRYNLRANVDLDVTKTTTLRVNVGGYLQTLRKQKAPTNEVFNNAFTTAPFVHPARYSDGTIPVVTNRQNPWAALTQQGYNVNTASQIQSLFAVEQNLKMITQGLKAKVTFSFDRWNSSTNERSKSVTYYNVATGRDIEGNLIHNILSYGEDALGHSNSGGYGNSRVYFEGTLTYNRMFGKNDIDALFLYNQSSYDDGGIQPYRKQGIAGRLSYTFDSRYVAEFNFGYNGSENFDKGKRFGFFPSVAIGWLISEEPFMAKAKHVVDKLKIRGSIGKVGNDNIGGRRFAYITTLNTDADDWNWGDTGQIFRTGISEGEVGVTNLTWETAVKANIGFELGLWNSLELQVDFFKEKRSNIFMQRKVIPSQTGFLSNPWANFGKVTNQGAEVTLNFNKQLNKDWFVGFRSNFTYAINRVDEYDEPISVKGTYRSLTGRSLNTLWGLQAERLFTADDFDADGNLKFGIPRQDVGATTIRPGDIKYKDMDGDGVVTDADEGFIGGTVDPRIVYGFGATVSYKTWDLNFFFQGTGDTKRIIGGSSDFIPGSGQGLLGNIYDNYNDRWTEDSPSQDVFWPRLSEAPNRQNYRASTWWKKDMRFMRLKTLELGYSLPKSLVGKIHAKNIRLYVSGNNLLCFSPFKMWDPELDTGTGLQYPAMRSVLLGVNLDF
jgi:TonB-linked SusC/RagA family outer membrane protein